MRISDWSSDVCSSDLLIDAIIVDFRKNNLFLDAESIIAVSIERLRIKTTEIANTRHCDRHQTIQELIHPFAAQRNLRANGHAFTQLELSNRLLRLRDHRSEEHTSELQSLMRISYAVFCLKKKKKTKPNSK